GSTTRPLPAEASCHISCTEGRGATAGQCAERVRVARNREDELDSHSARPAWDGAAGGESPDSAGGPVRLYRAGRPPNARLAFAVSWSESSRSGEPDGRVEGVRGHGRSRLRDSRRREGSRTTGAAPSGNPAS